MENKLRYFQRKVIKVLKLYLFPLVKSYKEYIQKRTNLELVKMQISSLVRPVIFSQSDPTNIKYIGTNEWLSKQNKVYNSFEFRIQIQSISQKKSHSYILLIWEKACENQIYLYFFQ